MCEYLESSESVLVYNFRAFFVLSSKTFKTPFVVRRLLSPNPWSLIRSTFFTGEIDCAFHVCVCVCVSAFVKLHVPKRVVEKDPQDARFMTYFLSSS